MSKNKNIYSLEFWKERGIEDKEALIKIEKAKKENSCFCKEFWMKKGLNEEESLNKIKEIQTKNSKKVDQKNKRDPYSINYWIELGKTKKEAIEKIEETKNKSNPYKNWDSITLNKILEKRKETYHSKTKEQKSIINKNRGRTIKQLAEKFGEEKTKEILKNRGKGRRNPFFRRYSKISETFFNELQNIFSGTLFYGKEEKWIRYNKNKGFYVDLLYNNKIIEFNGDFYHANPENYESDSVIKIAEKNILFAKEIWRKDEFKLNTLKKLGYDILIIWEKETQDNYLETLNKCKKFLQNEY